MPPAFYTSNLPTSIPKPYTLDPKPHTLHPSLWILHPTPYTLNHNYNLSS